ncbi:MAG: PAS domain S-box protein, partial [Desulfosarcinaceae bacterium]
MSASEKDSRQLGDHLQYLVDKQPAPNPWFGKDVTRDGRTIDTQVDWNYKRDVRGRVQGLIAVISEITHRKQAEKALLDNLAFMNTLIDTIPNPVFYKDGQGYFLGCNVAYAQTLGLPKEEIVGRRIVDLVHGSESDMAARYHDQDMLLIGRSGVQTHEEQVLCADGVLGDYVLYKATFENTEGAVAGLVGVMLDITERKKAEKELKESKNLFDAFMDNIPGLAYMKDPQGRYIFVNNAFAQFTGRPACDTVTLCNRQIWNEKTSQRLEENDNKVIQSLAAANMMETVLLPDGRERHLLTTRFPIFQDDRLFALGGVSIDVTERNQAEQQRQQLEIQLQQSQKMEALGTLAGGIAHDFNNILAAIIGYTEILAADTDKEHPNHHYLVRVLEAGERARALVKQILAFSRQSEIEPKPVQVKLIVKEVLKLLRASLPAFIEIKQDILTDAAVMADPVQIHQVMMNLCTNAGYAMRDNGGLLQVRLSEVDLDETFTRPHTGLHPGTYLKLRVQDTGAGISKEHLSRVFEPFFSTKPKGEGTGMGLSVVHGIVTRLGGLITVESVAGHGACFDVYLPALKDKPLRAVVDAKALPAGMERILFVDDEVFQTDMLKHMLELLGYKVTALNRGPEALARFEKDPKAFDLVITDMIMPEMTGDVLARRMLEIRPDLPIILCTGYSENISEPQAKARGIKAFVLKPLVMQELALLLRQVLDKRST